MNNREKVLKGQLKKSVRITLAALVAIAINGTLTYAGPSPAEKESETVGEGGSKEKEPSYVRAEEVQGIPFDGNIEALLPGLNEAIKKLDLGDDDTVQDLHKVLPVQFKELEARIKQVKSDVKKTYVRKDELNGLIGPDLTTLATKDELNGKADAAVVAGLATKAEIADFAKTTDLANYVTTTDLDSKIKAAKLTPEEIQKVEEAKKAVTGIDTAKTQAKTDIEAAANTATTKVNDAVATAKTDIENLAKTTAETKVGEAVEGAKKDLNTQVTTIVAGAKGEVDKATTAATTEIAKAAKEEKEKAKKEVAEASKEAKASAEKAEASAVLAKSSAEDVAKELKKLEEEAVKKDTILELINGELVASEELGTVGGEDSEKLTTRKQVREYVDEEISKTNQKVEENSRRIDRLGDRVDRAGALGAALAGLHQMQYDPLNPNQIMAALGAYRDAQAIAVGTTHYFNENLSMAAAVSMGTKTRHPDMMANLGFTYKFGDDKDDRRKNNLPEKYENKQMASIYMMQTELDRANQKNQLQEKKIEELTERLAAVEKLLKKLAK